MTVTPIDLESWTRKDHFNFFKDFTNPYFNVCVQLDMSALHSACKQSNIAFSSAYLFALGQALDDYAPMRYRIEEGAPVCFKSVSLSIVTLAQDETFRFVTIPSRSSFSSFQSALAAAKIKAHNEPLFSTQVQHNESRADVVHVSILPWLNFSAFSHATTQGVSQGIPKCVFGQFNPTTGMTPLSIDVHHALMDGLHVAKFIAELQKKLDELRVNS